MWYFSTGHSAKAWSYLQTGSGYPSGCASFAVGHWGTQLQAAGHGNRQEAMGQQETACLDHSLAWPLEDSSRAGFPTTAVPGILGVALMGSKGRD